jgi:hypothetical protein
LRIVIAHGGERSDSSYRYAAMLWFALRGRFRETLLSDVDSIRPGVDWVEQLEESVASADVVVAVIGTEWNAVADEGRKRRLDDPNDPVRVEIEAALRRGIPVIPVLVPGAAMPRSAELPEPLRMLARLEPIELTETRLDADFERLTRAIELARGEAAYDGRESVYAAPPPPAQRPLRERFAEAAAHGIVRGGISPIGLQAGQPSWFPELPPTSVDTSPSKRPPESPPAPLRRRRAGLLPLLLASAVGAAGVLAALKLLLDWLMVPLGHPEPEDDVDCTVFAPSAATPSETILVQAFVHPPEEADTARAVATEFDVEAERRAFLSLSAPVPPGTRLDFELRMPGLEIDDPVASTRWRRRVESVQFVVRIPAGAAAGTVVGTLAVSRDGAPLGHVKFKLTVGEQPAGEPEPQGEVARRYSSAFISYAARDREQVIQRVQLLGVVGIHYFHDVLSLDPGDRWERGLERAIDECDLFLLFWSSAAKESKWVRREVRHALARKGGDDLEPPEIRPVILEGPPIVEPWEELAHLHFNDRALYFMRPQR